MIGDNLQTDIMFGQLNQIHTLLVLSGCTSESKIKAANYSINEA